MKKEDFEKAFMKAIGMGVVRNSWVVVFLKDDKGMIFCDRYEYEIGQHGNVLKPEYVKLIKLGDKVAIIDLDLIEKVM